MVPHSQCSLRENPKFLQNLELKITQLIKNFEYFFNTCHCNSGLAFKTAHIFYQKISKTYVKNANELCE